MSMPQATPHPAVRALREGRLARFLKGTPPRLHATVRFHAQELHAQVAPYSGAPCPGAPYRASIHPPASCRSHAPQPACSVRHLQRIHPTLPDVAHSTTDMLRQTPPTETPDAPPDDIPHHQRPHRRTGLDTTTSHRPHHPLRRRIFHLRAPCICPPATQPASIPHPLFHAPPRAGRRTTRNHGRAPPAPPHTKKTEGLPRKGKAFSKMRIATKGYSRTTTSRSVLSTS